MDVRYQVFVSSTYEDLKEERAEVMQALLELDCIPAGMELFPPPARSNGAGYSGLLKGRTITLSSLAGSMAARTQRRAYHTLKWNIAMRGRLVSRALASL
jgi:hypothetical protein